MNIIPIKQQYDFVILNHTMRATAEHFEDCRRISYFFDNKLISTKILPIGSYLTDDDYIRDIVEDYSKSHTGVYADIFKNHTDKISLVSRVIELSLENSGILINAKVKVEKDHYQFEMATENGENSFSGRFLANDFPEVLEKVRIFVNTLEGVSSELTQNINSLSNDKIEELIKWKE